MRNKWFKVWILRPVMLAAMLLTLTGCFGKADGSCDLCGQTEITTYDMENYHGVGKCVVEAPCGVANHFVLGGKKTDKAGISHADCGRCGQPMCQGEHGEGQCESTSDGTAAKSDITTLKSLRLLNAKGEEIPLSEAFMAEQVNHTPKGAVSFYIGDTVSIEAVPSHYGATVKGTGTFRLEEKMNTFSIFVTAENGKNIKRYAMSVVADPKLSGDWSLNPFYLTLPDDTVVDLKDAEARQNIAVHDITGAKVTAVPSHSKAVVSGDVGDIAITAGENAYSVTVTAEDGTSQVFAYTINASFTPFLIAEPLSLSNDAALQSLTLDIPDDDRSISPSFAPDTCHYFVECDAEISGTLAATARHAGATVTGTGSFTLMPENTLTITVTAEDGVTTRTYTITAIE